jgi:hydroxypyruvate isomerase
MNLEGLNITTDHVGNFLKYTQDAAEMIRLIGSPKLKVLYDAYHMQINEGCICDTIKNYGDTFGHVHIADAPGRHEPGTGEIYYPRVYKALEEVGYDAYVGYELFPATTTAEAVKAIMTLV